MAGLVNIDAGSVAKEVMGGLDALFTSDEERAAARLAAEKVAQHPHILQALTNLEEAKHPSQFVAGWRPALGWLTVVCLGYAWLGRDFVLAALSLAGRPDVITNLPAIDTSELITLVFALLGLGGIRAYEKVRGVARENMATKPKSAPPEPTGQSIHEWLQAQGIGIKPGVDLVGLDLAVMGPVIREAKEVYKELGIIPVITSAMDGEHSPRSLHYKGRALDWRTRDMTPEQRALLRSDLGARLGPQYDCVLEDTHLHCEFDPKG